MTWRTVVTEQRPTGLPHVFHQTGVGLDFLEALSLNALGPGAALKCGLRQAFADGGALIDAEQALRIGHPERPCWHQHPVNDGEQGRYNQEEIDRPGYRRIQFLDAVPFVTGGHVAGMGIALIYRHGRSLYGSSSWLRIDRAASSNCFLFDGQYA